MGHCMVAMWNTETARNMHEKGQWVRRHLLGKTYYVPVNKGQEKREKLEENDLLHNDLYHMIQYWSKVCSIR